MTPSVQISKTDGNLGVASDTERILAIIGPASAGISEKASIFTNKADIVAEFQSGVLVEAGAYMVARGIPVVLIRTTPTTAGAYGTIDDDTTGTAAVTAGVTTPDGDYDVRVEVLTGGALGTAGIVYRTSHDGGVNWSDPQSLGTSLTLTAGRGVSFALGSSTQTLIAGDSWSVTTTGPKDLTADISAAFAALTDYSGEWLRVLVLTDADEALLAQFGSFANTFHAEGKYPEIIGCTRARGSAETRATYQAALATIRAGVQSSEVSCCVDQCEIVSEVNGWRLRLPQSIPYAARLMLIDDSQDAAAKADGALPGVFLETPSGERRYHDERRFPGLDALGFTTLRTWGGRPMTPGVYVNNPRVLSGTGSDYRYFQHTAIVNRIIETSYQLLQPRLSQSVLCDATTGKIRPDVATAIEDSISAELRTRYSDPGRVSAIRFVLGRNDNVLSTDTISFDVQAIPLAYVKKFIGKTGLVRTIPTT